MSMYDQFRMDKDLEKDGVWIDYGEFQVRLARAGGSNKAFQKALERLARPHRRAIAIGSLPNDMAEDMLRAAYAKAVIKGWRTKVEDELLDGIEAAEGEDLLPVTEENVLLTLKRLPDLFSDLQAQATDLAMYRAGLREEAGKN